MILPYLQTQRHFLITLAIFLISSLACSADAQTAARRLEGIRPRGGNISNINGTIRANDASLFLVNPAGILFGAGARLDLGGGSFYGSTADSILFEDGEAEPKAQIVVRRRLAKLCFARATDLDNPPLLTVNAPIGLSFRDNPEPITNLSTQGDVGLEVATGATIGLIGGEINLEGGLITAPGGAVELGGLSAAGEINFDENISFSFPEAIARADVSLNEGAAVNVSAGGDGSININARNLTLSEQSELFAGIAENMGSADAQAGDIAIDATESVRLFGEPRENIIIESISPGQFDPRRIAEITETETSTGIRNTVGLSAVRRSDGATISSAIGNGGNIEINTQTLELSNLTVIDTGVFGQGNGGNITINADEVRSNQGFLSTEVRGFNTNTVPDTLQERGRGDAGDISINAQSLSLTDATRIFTNIRSEDPGNAGDVNINVEGNFTQNTDSYILTQLGRNSVGSAGGINIIAGNYEIGNQGTLPEGGSFPALQSDSSPDSQGDAGGIDINVENNFSIDGNLILSQVQSGAEGTGGDIKITAGSFEASNGALVLADTNGIGSAGDITLTSDNIISLENGSQIQSFVNENATGNGGNVTLDSTGLSLANDSQIIADTAGISPNEDEISTAGDINIDISGDVNLDNNSKFQSQTRGGAVGNAGNITISVAGSLFSRNGNLILADSQAEGNGGNITLDVAEQIVLEGIPKGGFPSQIVAGLTGENARGAGGDIEIKASELILDDLAFISSRAGSGSIGDAGNITLDVSGLSISENAFIDVVTASSSDGGAITINAQTIDLASGGKILAAANSGGNAGDININVSEQITIDNSVLPSVQFVDFGDLQSLNDLQSEPSGIYVDATENATGIGGNVFVNSQNLELSNDGIISASSNSSQGGSIDLTTTENLTLRDGGTISAEAANNGDGGNVNIDSQFVIAFPDGNNDILATAEGGAGGDITINAESLFGIQERPENNLTNDIDASSDFSLNGNVNINVLNFDPIQGVIELPANIVQTENTVAQTCSAGSPLANANSFSIEGKGGVPATPEAPLSSYNILAGDNNPISTVPQAIETAAGKIQPARGIEVKPDGSIALTAHRTDNSGQRIPEPQTNCAG